MKITSLGNLVRHSKGWSTDLADFSSLEIAESSLFKYFNSLRPDAVLKTYDAEKHLANRQSRSSTHWKDDPTMNPPGGVANKYQNEHPRYRSMPVEQTPENPSNTIAE
jgi:hypothetical protein